MSKEINYFVNLKTNLHNLSQYVGCCLMEVNVLYILWQGIIIQVCLAHCSFSKFSHSQAYHNCIGQPVQVFKEQLYPNARVYLYLSLMGESWNENVVEQNKITTEKNQNYNNNNGVFFFLSVLVFIMK